MKWHYKSNGKYFANKFDAIDEFEESRHSLFLELPEIYYNFDFSVEPKEDLATLIGAEAVKVRQQSDYIRLFYSGGADSHAVLNAFVSNGLAIDEIVCFKSGFHAADHEIDKFAIPYLESIKSKLVGTSINITTPNFQDYDEWYGDDWTSKYFAHQFTSTVSFFRLMDQPHDFNDGATNIKGKDKPRIIRHKGKFYTYLSDMMEIETDIYHFLMENPALLAKQAHLLLNKLEDPMHHTQDQANKIIHNHLTDSLPKKEKYYTPGTMKYKNKDIYYANEKERLALIQAIEACPTALDNWINGINYMKTTRFSHWFNQGRPELGTTGVQSKFFCLTDNSVATVDELFPNGFTQENISAMSKSQ